MRVLMAPFFEGNQYLELLTTHLEAEGITVERSTTARPLALLLLDVLRSDADVLHLHWTHPYFLFGSYERFYRLPLVKYACWGLALFFLLQVYLATLLCDRVVWTVHNKYNHERRYEGMDRWVSRRVFSMADVVQVWDKYTKADFSDYLDVSPAKMIAVPHGNYFPLYPPEDRVTKAEARETLNLPSEKRVFLYFGIIRPYKQVPALLDAWAAVDPEDSHLVVAGNPKYERLTRAIEQRADDRDDVTTHLRYVPDEEVPTYFAACDFAVFPYAHIFNSGSVVLAMSMGRAFVAPQSGAIPSLDPGGNVLYRTKIETGIQEALNASEADLENIGRRNERIAAEHLAWNDIAEKLGKLYVIGS